jgi:hypothetical protein
MSNIWFIISEEHIRCNQSIWCNRVTKRQLFYKAITPLISCFKITLPPPLVYSPKNFHLHNCVLVALLNQEACLHLIYSLISVWLINTIKNESCLWPLCYFKLFCTQQSNTLINPGHLNFWSKSHLQVCYMSFELNFRM